MVQLSRSPPAPRSGPTGPTRRCSTGCQPASSWAGLAIAGSGSALVDTPVQTGVFVAAAMRLQPLGRVTVRVLVDMVRPLLWVLIPLAVFQVAFIGWARTTVLVDVILASCCCNAVTLTPAQRT